MKYKLCGFVHTPGVDPAFWTLIEVTREFDTLETATRWGKDNFDELVDVKPAAAKQDEKPF